MTPNPLWKSTYSLPSTSHTRAPSPRSTKTGQGSFFWNCDGTPPGMTRRARSKYSPERRVRSTSRAFSRRVSAAMRAGSTAVPAGVVVMAAIVSAAMVRLTRLPQRRAAQLPAGRARQLGRELDDPRIFVRRGLGLDVLLQLGCERVRRHAALAQHHDRADHAPALVVGRRDDGGLGHGGGRGGRGPHPERPPPGAGREEHGLRPPPEG